MKWLVGGGGGGGVLAGVSGMEEYLLWLTG